jgi:hypothetical protein
MTYRVAGNCRRQDERSGRLDGRNENKGEPGQRRGLPRPRRERQTARGRIRDCEDDEVRDADAAKDVGRSQALTMYIDPDFPAYEPLMKKLGQHTKGHSCLYIKKLEDVDMDVLKQLVTESYRSMKKKHKS